MSAARPRPAGPPELYAVTVSRRRQAVEAGVWLVFLAFPLIPVVLREIPLGIRLLGVAALVAFALVYLWAFSRRHLFLDRPVWVSTLTYSILLLALALAMAPAAGAGVMALVPYFAALWMFSLPLLPGLLVGTALTAAAVMVAFLWAGPGGQLWVSPVLVGVLLVLVIIRVSAHRDVKSHALAEQLVLAEQRESLARDVHDVLGHSLTVVAVKTELARRLVSRDPQRAEAELDEVLALTRNALTEVRSTVDGLRTPELGDQIASARTALKAAGISADLPSPTEAAALPESQRSLFAWCLREAVTNVVRHSGAQRCTVTLEPGRLRIHDDGVGLGARTAAAPRGAGSPGPTAAARSLPGHGLAGLAERVAQAGGTLRLQDAQPGADRPGTLVEVTL